MAFKFNFTSDDLDLEEVDDGQQLETSLHDLTLEDDYQKIACTTYDIEADILTISGSILYKRTLADVKFQMAEQDTLAEDSTTSEVASLLDLNGNSDLIRGVYEGGFKTWECSIDLVQYLATLPDEQVCKKKILELGCGSSLPSLYLLSRDSENKVDVQDYNEQVIRYITIPNILLNTILTVQEPTKLGEVEKNEELNSEPESDSDDDETEDGEEKDQIIGESVTCDAEAELPADQVPEMLKRVRQRTQAFTGDWSGLPGMLQGNKYDMIVTSETIYAEHALPDLIRVFQQALKKPTGVGYVAAKTVYFGVGGGILPFCDLLTKSVDADGDRLTVEKVYESESTVKREILKVTWEQK
ncbi:hypothetical protein EC973_003503 [Apophysomyces ossiformis]|uniref:protein-histidine N-methyltransferase n=1 Tax=Apophysomyces ossiformis TaxID=679940 RepID=A0A8H7BMG6_9FUNG|nr:hypothetical protein EC973_003503 [Apophysomyces ossiformis]